MIDLNNPSEWTHLNLLNTHWSQPSGLVAVVTAISAPATTDTEIYLGGKWYRVDSLVELGWVQI